MVMGILNTTDDSFYDGGKFHTMDLALRQCELLLTNGADIIDIGGQSTRPGAEQVSLEQELSRTVPVCREIARRWPESIISIDTFRAEVARQCADNGADIINDVSAGDDDPEMLPFIGRSQLSYIAMHKKGSPKTMQDDPHYSDVVEELMAYFAQKLEQIESYGNSNIIIDPGFGFGKTLKNNYEIMNRLDDFQAFGKPLLAGISRKSMIWKLLNITPEEALNGTSSLNTIALLKGAQILRVHDVKEALECVKIVEAMRNQ